MVLTRSQFKKKKVGKNYLHDLLQLKKVENEFFTAFCKNMELLQYPCISLKDLMDQQTSLNVLIKRLYYKTELYMLHAWLNSAIGPLGRRKPTLV